MPVSVYKRLKSRSFPSVFQAWSPAKISGVGPEDALARHDLVFHSPGFFGLTWDATNGDGAATSFTAESVKTAAGLRDARLARNPNQIHIAEIRYRDAYREFLPENHPWWKRDEAGKRIVGWEEGGYFLLDFANPDYRKHVAAQCAATMRSGVLDGVMLDWWIDDDDRLALIQEIRAAIGNSALVLANANDRQTPRTAPFLNGYFLECYRTKTPEDWRRIVTTLLWAEKNLRPNRINCLETWYETSRADLPRLRLTTTLSLCLIDGFCLFSDPNDLPTPDHAHDWYDFWNRSLGKPRATGRRPRPDTYTREFDQGIAVANLPDNPPFRFESKRPLKSAATGKIARSHTIPPLDGDLLLFA